MFFPVLLSYARVHWEVQAYAYNIVNSKRYTLDNVVDALWQYYFWPLPKPWIRWMLRRAVLKREIIEDWADLDAMRG